MRILMLHNRYAQLGGEDVSTRIEADALRAAGHQVDLWELSNDTIGPQNIATVALNALWSLPIARELSARLRAGGYDLMHVQNSFPLFSPAVHQVAASHGVPSIQHLRNFRQICASAILFRDGQLCHDCVGSVVPWRGVVHKCYRDSRAGSAVVAAMIGLHKVAGTWGRCVTRYIADSEYVRNIHIEAGFPAEKIATRANLTGPLKRPEVQRGIDMFIGSRLTPEKGVQTAIAAWRRLPRAGTLRIAGKGPYEDDLRALAAGDSSIAFLGQIAPESVEAEMARAAAVIVPSLWAEPFGRTALEAMAVGTPVLASAMGGLPEILGRESRALFAAGDVGALSTLIDQIGADPTFAAMLASDQGARFRQHFSEAVLLAQTEAIYAEAIAAMARVQLQPSPA
jgi:glycosyltransferase involved in cell wall biosynthesis